MNDEAWSFIHEPLPEERLPEKRPEADFLDSAEAVRALADSGTLVALTIKPVWAFLMAIGYMSRSGAREYKDIENRTRYTKYRGRFMIHASKGMTMREYGDAYKIVREIDVDAADALPDYATLLKDYAGRILGSAEISEVYGPNPKEFTSYWHFENNYGYRLVNQRALKNPIPAKGSLGFWRVPPEIRAFLK